MQSAPVIRVFEMAYYAVLFAHVKRALARRDAVQSSMAADALRMAHAAYHGATHKRPDDYYTQT